MTVTVWHSHSLRPHLKVIVPMDFPIVRYVYVYLYIGDMPLVMVLAVRAGKKSWRYGGLPTAGEFMLENPMNIWMFLGVPPWLRKPASWTREWCWSTNSQLGVPFVQIRIYIYIFVGKSASFRVQNPRPLGLHTTLNVMIAIIFWIPGFVKVFVMKCHMVDDWYQATESDPRPTGGSFSAVQIVESSHAEKTASRFLGRSCCYSLVLCRDICMHHI